MLGFIGAGAMGSAIIRGVLHAGIYQPHEIYFTRHNAEKAMQLSQELSILHAPDNKTLVQELGPQGFVILAVKPHLVAQVLNEIAPIAIANQTVIISVAAGTSIPKLNAAIGATLPIVRAMPNVNSAIGKSITALCPNTFVSDNQFTKVTKIFQAIGQTVTIAEKDFAAFTAIAGCSPAWTFTYIDALSKAALAAGMSKEVALKIAAQAVAGSAELVLHNLPDTRAQALVDTVTSPGGTTIAGILAMEKVGFTNSVIAAVEAAITKDNELNPK